VVPSFTCGEVDGISSQEFRKLVELLESLLIVFRHGELDTVTPVRVRVFHIGVYIEAKDGLDACLEKV
jgi:hypothetical protein